ncbi:TlpA family protein disulfide reductase [Bacillus shivajii]|uniref:peroxiredoxin family protein n=1 Tax=Bacillus shivajii TaxID=1983719 RepID=UPI001CFB0079|nr:TlpA disulfide reductase family protein [Bacillus shivajii]UCZ51622.1 TlpA family protein disulfide reductase [Bacillus shivajii]
MIHIKRSWFLLAGLSIVLFLWMGKDNSSLSNQGELAQVGHVAPNFSLPSTAKEDVISLHNEEAEYLGTVLYFWTSWCPYCAASMEAMQSSYSNDSNIRFLGVNVTSQDREEEAITFIGRHGITFPNVLDETGEVSQSYFVPPVPTTFFIGQDDIIVHRKVGALTNSDISQGLRMIKGGRE